MVIGYLTSLWLLEDLFIHYRGDTTYNQNSNLASRLMEIMFEKHE